MKVIGLVMLGVLGALTSAPAWAAAPDDSERILFTFRDKRITESSGIALSPTHPDIVYTHNDSDAGAQFFAVGMDGRTRATFTLAGAEARDWEAMAASTDPQTGRGILWFADIGDNLDGAWADISVYKVIEPERVRNATLEAVRYRFRYADGARNAEGIMVHPKTGRLYVISKEFSGSIYQAPRTLRTDRTNVLRRVGEAPIMATDAAYAPDGSSFVIRTYFSASVYKAPGKLLSRVTMPALAQSESVAYTRDGSALLTGSEGADSPVYEVPLPAAVTGAGESPSPAQPAKAPTAKPVAAADSGGVSTAMIAIWVGVAVGAMAIIGIIARWALR
ncbi:hypothetical protein Aph01nite_70520 [Acrocarpospora phusangensis]|uniref:WD40 repeat domain-containing protein n=1 Tax=Acrocarpospora phusangensis TaxID=1070424 RepID=A0A919US46_9ACTN|nr:hypothetical protein [Acrocarpospora phusangensis]GIH28742.1 hypothetical protein Aph01nite_70520 [Acrocarpospora phusangensis]